MRWTVTSKMSLMYTVYLRRKGVALSFGRKMSRLCHNSQLHFRQHTTWFKLARRKIRESQIGQQAFVGGVSKLSRRIMSFMNHVN